LQKILGGAVPSYKIFETEHVYAFLDAFPTARFVQQIKFLRM
jgi:diadenosine tetraphosphate (Ap4A) HIT family hydrolase